MHRSRLYATSDFMQGYRPATDTSLQLP